MKKTNQKNTALKQINNEIALPKNALMQIKGGVGTGIIEDILVSKAAGIIEDILIS